MVGIICLEHTMVLYGDGKAKDLWLCAFLVTVCKLGIRHLPAIKYDPHSLL